MPGVPETMAYSGQRGVPWHGLGVSMPGLADDEQILREAGIDWQVELRPVHTTSADGRRVDVAGAKVVLRTSDNAALGVVGPSYAPIQNNELITFGALFADTTGAKWDTAGSLRGGRVVWAMFRLDATDLVLPGGDHLTSWLLLSNTHDGTASMTVSVVKVRVVCCNTHTLALRTAQSTYRIRHRGNTSGKVAAARSALKVSWQYDRALQDEVDRLLSIDVPDGRFRQIIERRLLPAPTTQQQAGPVRPRLAAARASLLTHAATTPTVDDACRQTAWGRLQATTEWVQHVRPQMGSRQVSAEQRFLSVLSGPASQLERTAHAALLTAAR